MSPTPMPHLLLVLALAGCTTPEGAPAGLDSAANADDTGAPAAPALEATLTASEAVGTVATVSFATPDAANGWVEVQEDGGPLRRFPAVADADGTGHSATLAGLAADTVYTWRAVATLAGGEQRASEPAAFETPPPPLWLPALTNVVPAEDPWAPGFVLTTFLGDARGAAMFDRQGRYVWWWEPTETLMPCQVRMGLDGQSIVLFVVDQQMTEDVAELVRVGFDGETLWQARTAMGHHDFVELADGRFAYLAFDIQPRHTVMTVGDMVMLLDPATGEETKLWSVWEDLSPTDVENAEFYSFGVDWTHGNGLTHDPATGDWLVSLHNIDTLVRLSAEGDLRWILGGAHDDFTLTSGERFAQQHSPVLTEEGILLFDNKSPDPESLYSRAVEYRIDESARTYEQVWDHDGGKGLFSAFMGSVERTDAGRTLVGWGSGGRVSEVDADGAVTWQVESAVGSAFGFTHAVTTLGEVAE